jgi:hypothetical protein
MKRTTYDPATYAVLHEMGEYVASLGRPRAAAVDTNNHGALLFAIDLYADPEGRPTVTLGNFAPPSRERCVAEARRQLRWLAVRRAWWAVRAAVGLAWAWVAARRAG